MLLYQVYNVENEPQGEPEWLTWEQRQAREAELPEGWYVGVADGIELWEG